MKKIYIIILTVLLVTTCLGTAFSETETSTPINRWEGTWERDSSQFNSAVLKITSNTNDSFSFNIRAYSGTNIGSISGVATVINDTAIFDDNQGGILKFSFNDNKIYVTQTYEMYRYGGIGVFFNGTYNDKEKQKTAVVDENYFTHQDVFKKDQEAEFRRITGQYYLKFVNTAQFTTPEKDLDNSGARVYHMNVRGLFTVMEAIIMIRDSDNAIWAAVIDKDKVLYFTNTNDIKYVPITISRWHDGFSNKPIYYTSSTQ